jgi:hypothetical protein
MGNTALIEVSRVFVDASHVNDTFFENAVSKGTGNHLANVTWFGPYGNAGACVVYEVLEYTSPRDAQTQTLIQEYFRNKWALY